jgi:hypothetical protein
MRLQTLSLTGAVAGIRGLLPVQGGGPGTDRDEDLDHEAVDPDHQPQPVEDPGDDGG